MIAYDYAPILATRRSWRRFIPGTRTIAVAYLVALVVLS